MNEAVVIGRPDAGEYAPYYEKYVSRVPEADLVETLARNGSETIAYLRKIPQSRAEHRYAPEKWSIRDVVQHVVDSERVFGFRAFWFARGSAAPLPGFEQDDFIRESPPATALAALCDELDLLRRSHVRFFSTLPAEAWSRTGTASGNPFSVRALAAIMIGHFRHHAAVLGERYGA